MISVAEFKKKRDAKVKSRYEEKKEISGRVAALSETATEFGLSEHTVDSIIYPRNKNKTNIVPKQVQLATNVATNIEQQ